MITALQLIKKFPALLSGNLEKDIECTTIASPEKFNSGDIIACDDDKILASAMEKSEKPGLIITNKLLAENIPATIPTLVSSNPRLAHAFIKQLLNDYDRTDPEWEKIHPSAVIHSSTNIPDSCRIGPNVIIGSNVSLGENIVIRSNSVIEHDCVIGDDCTVHAQVNIGYGSRIGERVIIRSGAVIGNEGFGFVPDENNHYHRVPHTGFVDIQDDVQIGPNCNVDRGTYGPTLIKRGCKLDSLCHIAHNVVLGENCILVSQCGIAGSTIVGDRVILSGQTGVLDHLNIADDAILVHRAGVIADIPEKGMWAGLPPKPIKEYMRNLRASKRLEKKLARLEETIEELKTKLGE